MSGRLRILSGLLILVLISTTARAAASAPSSQPARLVAAEEFQGELKNFIRARVPAFVCPTDAQAWDKQSALIREQLLKRVVLRGVPDRWLAGPVEVVWGGTIAADGYTIRKLRYQAAPGFWVGALLYEPARLEGQVPAVLNANGHVGAPGMTIDYKQVRCINLAKRGMLALSTEFIGMGQLSGAGYAHDDPAYLELCGRSGVSLFYLALKRALDVLCAHPSADPKRIAVTGLSGGGWQTILISALDTRVRLAAPNAGYIGMATRVMNPPDVGDFEQSPADLLTVADYVHMTALLAPRPALLIYNAKDDCCFPAERARASVYDPVVPVYALYAQPERFALHVNSDPGTHNYLKDNRQAFYRFLNRHFLPESQRRDDEIPVDKEIRPQQELAIEYPPGNATVHTLAAEAMKSLRTETSPADKAPLETRRARLREVLHLHGSARAGSATPVTGSARPVAELAASSPTTATPPAYLAELADRPAPATLWRLHINNEWTVPVLEVRPGAGASAGTVLIIPGAGSDVKVSRAALQGSSASDRILCANVLFTGDCMPADMGAGQYASLIDATGARPLGIQVQQLSAVLDWIEQTSGRRPLRIVTIGRVAGLAALGLAAVQPGRVEQLQLWGMDAGLKDLLAKKVGYAAEPSCFCFGLLELADVPDLIEMARPTRVERR